MIGARAEDLQRIEKALAGAGEVLRAFTPGEIEHRRKAGGDPVTEADTAVDEVLHAALPAAGEGWLSEETLDDASRLQRRRVWVVDPLDGTREFVAGIPEWCVSIGLVEDGRPVAGGILIPARELIVLGAVDHGVTANGRACRTRELESIEGIEVLASRSEVKRGEWERFGDAPFTPGRVAAARLGLCRGTDLAASLLRRRPAGGSGPSGGCSPAEQPGSGRYAVGPGRQPVCGMAAGPLARAGRPRCRSAPVADRRRRDVADRPAFR